jgi:spoIIIJ-associated protein
MLYCDQIAPTEAAAVEAACRHLRLSPDEVIIRSVAQVPEGVKVRVESKRSRGQEALDVLKILMDSMHIDTELFYIEAPDKITLNVTGDNLGLVIGKNGSTLESLEAIINAIHNRTFSVYKPVIINPGGYRENKRKALKILVRRAIEAAQNYERVSLPLMSQRDRKLVHQILKDFPGFRSRSVGEGNDRHVCIFRESDEDKLLDEHPDEKGMSPSELSKQQQECDSEARP